MIPPLEDNFEDILGKALRGLGHSEEELARRSGLSLETVRDLLAGRLTSDDDLRAAAAALEIDSRALLDLARKAWQPSVPEFSDGFAMVTTTYGDMTVNAYVAWDPASRQGTVFDSGADCGPILALIREKGLRISDIFLTHAHPDHVADFSRLVRETGGKAWISAREPHPGAASFADGASFRVGNLSLETRPTWGHSPGGTTYVIDGLEHPLAIVGDSLFAGSMGGSAGAYREALRNNLEQILTLPDPTILAPGHGPLTTVEQEKRQNPFFAGRV